MGPSPFRDARLRRVAAGPGPCVLRAVLLVFALVLGSSPRSLATETWTADRPEDLSEFGLSQIRFTGDLPVPESELRDVIKSSEGGLNRFRAVDPERLETDAQRIRAHLRHLGYWKADVTVEIEYETGKKTSRACFTVTAGARRVIGRITTAGNTTFEEAELLTWIKQKEGDPFDLSGTDRDRVAVENTYANRGFYEVHVTADIQAAANDSTPVVHDLIYRVVEGPRYVVGTVRIEGNVSTKTEIVRRELTVRPGETLSREAVEESRQRLYSTGYFGSVTIQPAEGSRPEAVDLVVRVKERETRYVGAGLGYGTRDQLRVSAEWGHRNLWGRGKRASLEGIFATELFPTDLVRTGVNLRFVEPWLFNTRTTGSVELSYERSREYTNEGDGEYDLGLVSLLMNASRQLTKSTRGWAMLENEWSDVDPEPGVVVPDGSAPEITRSMAFTVERDRRNDYFEPQRGFLNRLEAGWSGGILGGDNDFWRVTGEAQWFRPARRVTLAGRLRVGYERPFGNSDFVPDRERYKLGGPSTVRGYDWQEIGPGDFQLLGNVEVRIPLVWGLSAGVFVDGGNAWEGARDVSWTDFRLHDTHDDPELAAQDDVRYAVGGGLRFGTPVGPLRVDAARRLKILPVAPGEPDDEPRWGYDFSLGHVF